MKSNIKFINIKRSHGLLKFCYYASIIMVIICLIVTFATPILPDDSITFQKGIREWLYSIDLPIGIGSGSFTLSGSITRNLLPPIPIERINVTAAIIIDSIIHNILLLLLIITGLKKLTNFTNDLLNGKSPFQLNYIRSLRNFSFIIILYSTLGNILLCILFSIFVTGFINITFNFMWSGVFIGIMGYIFSDILNYGFILQDE